TLFDAGHWQESARVLQQAARLSPQNAKVRFDYGKSLLWEGLEKDAEEAMEGVLADALDIPARGTLWSALTAIPVAQGAKGRHPRARGPGHRRFLDLAAEASREELQELLHEALKAPPSESKTRGKAIKDLSKQGSQAPVLALLAEAGFGWTSRK